MRGLATRRLSIAAAALAALALFAAAGAAAGGDAAHQHAQAGKASPAWESMKSLQGDWEGLYQSKVKTSVSYRLVSNGTALMETLVAPDASDMVTMYHPDGERVAMTHYCSENTQSRMRAPGTDGKRIAFSFVDVSNLASPDAMRMTGLVLTLKDPDHFSAQWTGTGMGKSDTSLFEFTRKK
ncbi:MAG TPA: hypothetical protein VE007_01270 [Thermoanaerobaculia bacterium]|nr:hypothetical protein [Thermoanaerobaculia bacterium]